MQEPSTVLHVPLSQSPARIRQGFPPKLPTPWEEQPTGWGWSSHLLPAPLPLSEAPPGWCCAGSRGLETYPQEHSTCPATDVYVHSPETFHCASQFDAREMDTYSQAPLFWCQ